MRRCSLFASDGVTTRYAYDAAGRMVREGSKTYRYGYLDKVMSVTDGDTTRTFTYHADGQLASAMVGSSLRGDSSAMVGAALRADRGRVISPERSEPRKRSLEGRDAPLLRGDSSAMVGSPLRGDRGRVGDAPLPAERDASATETFQWDGLALIQRGDEQFINEPHVGGGNPVASSKGTSYFNDALGTTVGSKQGGKYSAAALTAFGEDLTVHSPTPTQNSNFFTGKPYVEGLGHAFLMRNYRAGLAKWQTADPLGYPDGWNQLAYCNNGVTSSVDLWGCKWVLVEKWDNELSNPKMEPISRTAPSADELWKILTRYGEFGWLKPYQHEGVEKIIGPVVSKYESKTEYIWYKSTTIVYSHTRVDTLGVTVTTKELKDDPSLLNAVADLALTFGSKIKGPAGVIIGLTSDVITVADAALEIRDCINQYGQETIWNIEFGTETYAKERRQSWGFLYVNE